MMEKRRAEQSMRGMLLLRTHYDGTKVMPIYGDERSQEGTRNLRVGASRPPIPPKNLSVMRGRTVSPAGRERREDSPAPSLLLIILLSQNGMWGYSANFLQ